MARRSAPRSAGGAPVRRLCRPRRSDQASASGRRRGLGLRRRAWRASPAAPVPRRPRARRSSRSVALARRSSPSRLAASSAGGRVWIGAGHRRRLLVVFVVRLGARVGDLADRQHEVVPDLGRERAARDRLAAVLGLHRLRALWVSDPHRDGHVVVEADEPGVLVVLGGAGLAGGELADRGRAARSARDHACCRICVACLATPSGITRLRSRLVLVVDARCPSPGCR